MLNNYNKNIDDKLVNGSHQFKEYLKLVTAQENVNALRNL